MLTGFAQTMRLRQWTKNGFVFFALIFDKQLFRPTAFVKTLEGSFILPDLQRGLFIDDIADVEADRQHPEKKTAHRIRKLTLNVAWSAAIILVLVHIAHCYFWHQVWR